MTDPATFKAELDELQFAAGRLLFLLASQKQFGPSPDGAVERDIEAAIGRLGELLPSSAYPVQP